MHLGVSRGRASAALLCVEQAAHQFTVLDSEFPSEAIAAQARTCAAVDEIADAVRAAEQAGCARQDILAQLSGVRAILARSALFGRLQNWPRGYQGDFETVDYLVAGVDPAGPRDIAWHCELRVLRSPLAEQLRNRMRQQSAAIAVALAAGQSVLCLAAGSGLEIAAALALAGTHRGRLVVHDCDGAALAAAKRRLGCAAKQCRFVTGNLLHALGEAEALGPFDLIATTGLADHLPDASTAILLGILRGRQPLRRPGSRIWFANLCGDHPYRIWLDYFTNWQLMPRSREHLAVLLRVSGFRPERFAIDVERTGLAWIVTART